MRRIAGERMTAADRTVGCRARDVVVIARAGVGGGATAAERSIVHRGGITGLRMVAAERTLAAASYPLPRSRAPMLLVLPSAAAASRG